MKFFTTFLRSGCTLFSFVLKWWICYSAFCFFVTFFILFSDSYLNKPDHSTERVYRGKFRNHPHSLSPYWLTGWDGFSQKVPLVDGLGWCSAKVSPLVDVLGWVQPRCPIGWRAVIASLAMFPEFVTFLLSVPIGWRAVRASLALFPLVVTMLQVSYWLTGFDKQPSPVPIGCFYFAKCYDWLTGWDDPNRIVTAEPWVPDPGSVFHLQKSEQFR